VPFAPHEVENKKFVVALRGYAKDEVDAFLRAVAADYRALLEDGSRQPPATELPADMTASIEMMIREAWDAAAENQEKNKEKKDDVAEEEAAVDEPGPLRLVEAPAPMAPAQLRLYQLEKLVHERADEFPERQDEWAYTLFYLRDYANPEGELPASFDSLIEEVFGPLLDR
jgi:DivIVA domain-containing protein